MTPTIFIGSLLLGTLATLIGYNKKFQEIDIEAEVRHAKKAVKPQVDAIKESAKRHNEMMKKSLKEEEEMHAERMETLQASLSIKDNALKRKTDRLNDAKKQLTTLNDKVKEIKNATKEIQKTLTTSLEERATISVDEAAEELRKEIELAAQEMSENAASKASMSMKDDIERVAKRQAKWIVQRFSDKTSVERINTNVSLPRDKMIGMLIGKNGVNILYLESLFPNVDFIFNDQKGQLTITGFNLLQRHIAKATVHALLSHKAISPQKIKHAYDKAKARVDKDILRTGGKALRKIGIKDVSRELTWLTGRLKFRRSYGQNILKHSLEVAFFAEMIASELKCDVKTARIAAFFHDIGKAVDHDIDTDEGHDYLSKEILEKEGFSYEIVHAAWVHHDAMPQETPEAHIVKAADAMSAGRPGARQETMESYLERIKALEKISGSMRGVKKSYAVSAGREMRLFVDPKVINDKELQTLADSTAGKIEEAVTFPGKIKVMVIRKSHATDVAK